MRPWSGLLSKSEVAAIGVWAAADLSIILDFWSSLLRVYLASLACEFFDVTAITGVARTEHRRCHLEGLYGERGKHISCLLLIGTVGFVSFFGLDDVIVLRKPGPSCFWGDCYWFRSNCLFIKPVFWRTILAKVWCDPSYSH